MAALHHINATDLGEPPVLQPMHVHIVLGLCYASIALLTICLGLLQCRPFSRYRLGCLLIIRWHCGAELLSLLNKICFALLDWHVTWPEAGRHLTTWVCKLYHFSDNATLTLQVWVLVLFAMERAAMSLRLDIGLKHFSAFRLRIGVAVAGVVGTAAHLNYLWMFSVVGGHRPGSGPSAQGSQPPPPPPQSQFPEYAYAIVDDLNASQHLWPPAGMQLPEAAKDPAAEQMMCSILPEFHEIYSVLVVLDVLVNVYAPIAICTVCALLVLQRWCQGRIQRLNSSNGSNGGNSSSHLQPARYSHYRQVHRDEPLSIGQQNRDRGNGQSRLGHTSSAAPFQSAELVNVSARVLFLALSLVCYPPLAVTGLFKAQTVHSQSELSHRIYPILYFILQPVKNILGALAHCGFVAGMLLAHRNAACRRLLPRRYRGSGQDGVVEMTEAASSLHSNNGLATRWHQQQQPLTEQEIPLKQLD